VDDVHENMSGYTSEVLQYDAMEALMQQTGESERARGATYLSIHRGSGCTLVAPAVIEAPLPTVRLARLMP
jgi:hypothetical protein